MIRGTVWLMGFSVQITIVLVLLAGALFSQNAVASSWKSIEWQYSLDLSSRYLFRSQNLGESAPTLELGAVGATPSKQILGGHFRGVRGPTEADAVTHLYVGQQLRFAGITFSLLAEYFNWHHSDYYGMTPLVFSAQKEAVRFVVKQDLAEGGESHLELNVRALQRDNASLVVNVINSSSPLKDVVTVTSVDDPDNPGTPIVTRTAGLEETALQFISLQTNYDLNNELRLYGVFYHHLKEQADSSTWQIGVRWIPEMKTSSNK